MHPVRTMLELTQSGDIKRVKTISVPLSHSAIPSLRLLFARESNPATKCLCAPAEELLLLAVACSFTILARRPTAARPRCSSVKRTSSQPRHCRTTHPPPIDPSTSHLRGKYTSTSSTSTKYPPTSVYTSIASPSTQSSINIDPFQIRLRRLDPSRAAGRQARKSSRLSSLCI